MSLQFWNTASRKREEFKPLHPPRVGLYTCGPTVYNPATIGNLRTYVFEDVLKRALVFFGYEVKHVMNITDVGHLTDDGDDGEDKMEREAAQTGQSAWEIAKKYEAQFFRDLHRLHILHPDVTPRATEHIAEQIALVRTLEEKGFAYRTDDGMYFDTKKFDAYGRLSGQRMEEKEAGARVVVHAQKKHPADFALWKFSPPGSRRQMEWESPWGKGFPGWHLECSAMSVKYLGQPFDIHAGGVDHIAVHHENEIAQSESAEEKPLARYWMHSEFLLVDGRRMGKSKGNAFTLDDVMAQGCDPRAFRYYCLGTQYRSKMNFTWEGVEGARASLTKLEMLARRLPRSPHALADEEALEKFAEAIADDLNTAKALSVMWWVLESERSVEIKAATLLKMDEVLGLDLKRVVGCAVPIPSSVHALAEERQHARREKNWKTSDELRERIAALGWRIEDTDSGYDLAQAPESLDS